MKNLQRILVITTITITGTVLAQPPGGPRSGGRAGGPGGPAGHRGGHPIVRALDADRDGAVSGAELGSASAAILTLDTDRDGAVSSAELHARPARPADAPQRPEGAPERPLIIRTRTNPDGTERSRPLDPVMLALDADSNGTLSAAEIANAAMSLSALDANKDGQLTRDEVRPLPPVE